MEEVLLISDVAAILHNILIRMGQREAFAEEAGDSEILLELYNEEEEKFAQSTFERITNETLEIAAVAEEMEEESEGIMIRELAMTNNHCFHNLQAEFVGKYSDTT